MKLRSLLFVPGDRPDRFGKAAASGADAVILDLEDSVAPERKDAARADVAAWLKHGPAVPAFVRINPLASGWAAADLDAALAGSAAGLVLPKAEGAASIIALRDLAAGRPLPPVLPIATETPAAVFMLGSYAQVGDALCGLTWGAEDLPAAVGATTAREADGRYTSPYETARALTLFAAHAAGVPAIETIFPGIADKAGLAAYVAHGRRDGFSGMMAIHPAQVPVINAGFTPGADELAQARAIVAAFAANPGAGVLKVDGRMVDRPHLLRARRLLAASGDMG